MSESMGNIGKPDAKARGRERTARLCSLVMAILLDLAPMRATLGKRAARLDRAQGHTGYVSLSICLALADKTGCDKTGFDLLARFLACFVGGLEGLGKSFGGGFLAQFARL